MMGNYYQQSGRYEQNDHAIQEQHIPGNQWGFSGGNQSRFLQNNEWNQRNNQNRAQGDQQRPMLGSYSQDVHQSFGQSNSPNQPGQYGNQPNENRSYGRDRSGYSRDQYFDRIGNQNSNLTFSPNHNYSEQDYGQSSMNTGSWSNWPTQNNQARVGSQDRSPNHYYYGNRLGSDDSSYQNDGAYRQSNSGIDRGHTGQQYTSSYDNSFGNQNSRLGSGQFPSIGNSNSYPGYTGQDSGNQFSGNQSYTSSSTSKKGPKGYKRSDERLKEDICERLAQYAHLDVSEVSVEVKEGSVTLEGTVNNRQAKHQIENIVDEAMGVQDIDNRIRVNSSYSSSHASNDAQNSRNGLTTSSQNSGSNARNLNQESGHDNSGQSSSGSTSLGTSASNTQGSLSSSSSKSKA